VNIEAPISVKSLFVKNKSRTNKKQSLVKNDLYIEEETYSNIELRTEKLAISSNKEAATKRKSSKKSLLIKKVANSDEALSDANESKLTIINDSNISKIKKKSKRLESGSTKKTRSIYSSLHSLIY